jgi:hypothetical protein
MKTPPDLGSGGVVLFPNRTASAALNFERGGVASKT